MSDAHKKSAGSLQQQAIHDYLESLLMEVDDELQQAPPAQEFAQPGPPVVGLDRLVEQIPEEWPEEAPASVLTDTATVTVSETEARVIAEPVSEELAPQTVALEASVPEPHKQAQQSAVPEWAEQRFQCLLFKVSGLSLAVPLVKLNSVIVWDENITETPNQTSWYLGLIQHLQKQVKVIDTALLVLPENRRDALNLASADRLRHILLVDDYQWGLACDDIGEVVWLTKDEVKWRQNKHTRPWLAGTSLQHLCAIMDTEVFANMLNNPG